MTEVCVLATGTANTASVLAAFRRLGRRPATTEDPHAVEHAPLLVVPGVGAFGAALARLEQIGAREALSRRLAADRPTLCICLGMQILGAGSEESPGVRGLELFEFTVRRFPRGVRTPQLGWNRVVSDPACRWLQEGDYYFANSYRLAAPPAGVAAARADHGGPFVAAFEHGNLLACQFHPELSSTSGHEVLSRWLEDAEDAC